MTMWNHDSDKQPKEWNESSGSITSSSRTLRLLQVLDIMESSTRTISNGSGDEEEGEEEENSNRIAKDLETHPMEPTQNCDGADEESQAPEIDACMERAPSPEERHLQQLKTENAVSRTIACFGVGVAVVSFGLAIGMYFMPC